MGVVGTREVSDQVSYKRKIELRPTILESVNGPAGVVTRGQRKPTFRLTGRSWPVYGIPSYLRGAVNIAEATPGYLLQKLGQRIYEFRIEP
jgi:hypothetical protein